VRGQSIHERVVIIFPGALGDLLLALPALRALRARHADAHVIAVVNEPLRGIAAVAGVADATVALDAADSAALFAGEQLPSWMANEPVLYSWLGATDPSVRKRVSAAARSATFLRVERGSAAVHAAKAYARAVGAPLAGLASRARIVPPPSPAADDLFRGVGATVLAVHAGAGARSKRWDAAGFVQVAHWWRGEGGTVVSLAGPAELEEPPLVGAPDVRDWPLTDVAAVLGRAALYIGNDSGVSHLAGAVGTPGVVLFGPTDPHRWRPVAGRLVALRARASAPDGIALGVLPAARVIAACRRRFALTRGDLATSVRA
jgi:ADP-heptose:LPS heptosyltransferase